MKINLLRGSLTYGAVTIFSRIAAVILIPILTRLMTPVEYGVLNMALTIITLATLVVTLEVAQAVTLYFTDKNRSDRSLYPGTAIIFYGAMYVFFIAIAALFGPMIFKAITGDSIGGDIIFKAVLLLATNGIFFLIQNQLRLEFKTREYAGFTIGYVLLISLGAVAGAMLSDRPAEAVILGQALGAAIIDVIAVIMFWRRFSSGFNYKKLREMLRFSLPLVPAGLLLLGGQQLPKFILGMYGSLEDVGIYGLAYQIAQFSSLAVLGVQTSITPSVLENHHAIETPKMLARLFDIFTIVALIICSFLSVFSHELILIFSTTSFGRAANFVPFLAFSIAFNTIYIFFPGKIITGKSGKQLTASIGSFLVAVVTGVVLIRYDGVRGAALSTLLSAAIFFFIWCYISQKLYHLPINWAKLLKSTALAVVVCSVGVFLLPAGISFYVLTMKCTLLILFSCLIGWGYIVEVWKKYRLKNTA